MGNQQNGCQQYLKPYPEHPKIHVCSDGYLINSVTGKEWYCRLNKDGYIYFQYTKDKRVYSRKVHRVVAELFVDIPENLDYVLEPRTPKSLVVKHKDNNKLNNHYTNLEWGTHSDNTKEAHRDGIIPYLIGVKHGMCKMTEEQVRQVCEIYFSQPRKGKPPSSKSVAELLGLTFKQVVKIRNKETWKHIVQEYCSTFLRDYPEKEYTQASGNAEPSLLEEKI
jgi:hypothetical protein